MRILSFFFNHFISNNRSQESVREQNTEEDMRTDLCYRDEWTATAEEIQKDTQGCSDYRR